MADITRPYLTTIEQGTASARMVVVWRIADALDVTMAQLFAEPFVMPEDV
jgi:transcriptional regulator with XRE-family HTH domain